LSSCSCSEIGIRQYRHNWSQTGHDRLQPVATRLCSHKK